MEPESDDELLEMKEIYDKWQHTQIPPDLQRLLNIEFKTARFGFTDLVARLVRLDLLSAETGQRLVRTWNDDLDYSILSTVLTGLELAERMNLLRGPVPADEVITFRLDFEEFSVLDACFYATKHFILRKPSITKTSLSRHEEFVLRRIEEVQGIVGSQAQESSQNFPLVDVKLRLDSSVAFTQMLAAVIQSIESAILDYYTSSDE